MQIGFKRLFLVAFLITFALGVRAFAITIENDAATGIGVLAAAFLASFGFTTLDAKPWIAWLIGVTTTTTMCVVDTLERTYQSSALECLWRDPIQGQYAADPELGMIATFVLTFFATIISCFGVGAGILVRRVRRDLSFTHNFFDFAVKRHGILTNLLLYFEPRGTSE